MRSRLKVLLTGGSGFIGSNLVGELERRGHEVWICDLTRSWKPNYSDEYYVGFYGVRSHRAFHVVNSYNAVCYLEAFQKNE